MFVYSYLSMNKSYNHEDRMRMAEIWNNLNRAMLVMNGEDPYDFVIGTGSINIPRGYSHGKFRLHIINTFHNMSIEFRYSSDVPGSGLNTIAATTCALEYVVGREEALDITSWTVSEGFVNKSVCQDVGVDSIASVLGYSREGVIDFLEEVVEPKLDEIERVCL